MSNVGLLVGSSIDREHGTMNTIVGSSAGAELVTSDDKLVGSTMERDLVTESSLVGLFDGETLVNLTDGLLYTTCST